MCVFFSKAYIVITAKTDFSASGFACSYTLINLNDVVYFISDYKCLLEHFTMPLNFNTEGN